MGLRGAESDTTPIASAWGLTVDPFPTIPRGTPVLGEGRRRGVLRKLKGPTTPLDPLRPEQRSPQSEGVDMPLKNRFKRTRT